MRRVVLLCLAGATLASATACGGQLLTWRAQPPAPSLTGKVAIAVTDHRVAMMGGQDPSLVGSERGVMLVKNDLRLSSPTEAADTIRELLGQAARTAGIDVDGDGAAPLKLAAEIQQLWCEGVLAAYTKARLTAAVTLVGSDGAPRAPAMRIDVEHGGGSCRDAFKAMLTDAYSQAAALLAQPPVKSALAAP